MTPLEKSSIWLYSMEFRSSSDKKEFLLSLNKIKVVIMASNFVNGECGGEHLFIVMEGGFYYNLFMRCERTNVRYFTRIG